MSSTKSGSLRVSICYSADAPPRINRVEWDRPHGDCVASAGVTEKLWRLEKKGGSLLGPPWVAVPRAPTSLNSAPDYAPIKPPAINIQQSSPSNSRLLPVTF